MLVLQERPPRYDAQVVSSLAYSSDGGFLAVASSFRMQDWRERSHELRVWDLASGTERLLEYASGGPDACVCLGADGRILAAGIGTSLRIWDGRTYQPRARIVLNRGVRMLDVHPGGGLLAGANAGESWSRDVHVWDVTGSSRETPVRATRRVPAGVWSLGFAPDGRTLALGSLGVELWDFEADAPRGLLMLRKAVPALAFTPDGRTLILAVGPRVLQWDRSSRRPEQLADCGSNINCLAISPDGRTLAAGADDGLIRLWDLESGADLDAHDWQIGAVRALAFSPDGATAAAGGDGSQNLIIWDL